MLRSVLIGSAVVVVEYLFIAFFVTAFNGMQETTAAVLGAAFFLAFELVICTGMILSRLDRTKSKNSSDNAD